MKKNFPEGRGPSLLVLVMMAFPLLAMCVTLPTASAVPVVLDTFVGGADHVTLEFKDSAWNASIALELPRGATVLSAELVLEGIEGPSMPTTVLDFNSTDVGADLWAAYNVTGTQDPPADGPYDDGWNEPAATDIQAVAEVDNDYWYSVTPTAKLGPPWEWPVQLFHFNPHSQGPVQYWVRWAGYSECAANQSNLYHAEMWAFNHTSSGWEMLTSHTAVYKDLVWMNSSFDSSSGLVATNGSVDVAIVGMHSEMKRVPQGAITDFGHLYTNYIRLETNETSAPQFPTDVILEVGASELVNLTGPLSGALTVGDVDGLLATLQSVIDAVPVGPGNVTVAFNVSVRRPTMASVLVRDLRVEYEPLVNTPPGWSGPGSLQLVEDSPRTTVMVLDQTFTDDQGASRLAYEVADVSDGANLSVWIGLDGTGNRTLDVEPSPDFFGTVLVRLRATDPFGAALTTPLVEIVVLPVADGPRFVDPGEVAATQDLQLLLTLEVVDPDLPDDALAFSDSSELLDVDPATGLIDWTPGSADVGLNELNVTVTDGFGLSDTLLLRLNVTNVNDPPRIVSVLAVDAVQDQTLGYDILVEDPDVALGDIITYSATSSTAGVVVNGQTGRLIFQPSNADVGTVVVVLHVRDAAGEVDEATLVVTVANVNDPPYIEPLGPLSFTQGDHVRVRLVFGDVDLDIALPVAESLTVTTDGPSALMPDADGWIDLIADQTVVGERNVLYTVTDRAGATASMRVHWDIQDVNDPPVITSHVPASVVAKEDATFTLTLTAQDADPDTLVWSDDSQLFVIDAATGAITFVPVQADVGTHHVTITVADGRGGEARASLDIVVENVNDAPVVTSMTPAMGTRFKRGEAIVLEATATDEDGDALTYVWTSGGKQLGQGARLEGVKLASGKHTIMVQVSDGTNSTSGSIDVEVSEEEDAPSMLLPVIIAVVVVAAVAVALFVRQRKVTG